MISTLVINVDELWLKGKNRPLYFKALKNHVKEVIKLTHTGTVRLNNENQRLVANSGSEFEEATLKAVLRVPGIHSVAPARVIEPRFDAIYPVVKEELLGLDPFPKTFRVSTKRTDKNFPMKSMEISRDLGAMILNDFADSHDLKVAIKGAELNVEVKVLKDHIYVSTKTVMGVGGLPFGTSGHMVTLLSGGFDSPVASYLMAKRGVRLSLLFFYAYPYVGEEVKEKIIELGKVIGSYQKHVRLFIVPFGAIQNEIAKTCREAYRTVLFRKYMIAAANTLADRIGADALVTGDSLGQVSSQTINNMTLLDKDSGHTIFRPLVGYNKVEIIELSKKIGTHDISIVPHDDACALFAPKHPVLRADPEYWAEFEAENDLSPLINEAIDEAEIYTINAIGEIKGV